MLQMTREVFFQKCAVQIYFCHLTFYTDRRSNVGMSKIVCAAISVTISPGLFTSNIQRFCLRRYAICDLLRSKNDRV